MSDATSILSQLNSLDLTPTSLATNPKSRKLAIDLSKRLTNALTDPITTATEMVFKPFIPPVVRIGVDLDLYSIISTHSGPISTAELAKRTGGDELLIMRLLRVLAGIDFVRQVTETTWESTPITTAMALPAVAAGHRFVWDIMTTSVVSAPKYLRETKHRCPAEPTDGYIQYHHQSKLPLFELLCTKPSLLADFNNFMGNVMGAREYWVDWFPIQERLLEGYDGVSVLLVDVGGGRGHDVQAFYEKFPGNGGLVLQDLPQALERVLEGTVDKSIECIPQDFFEENQVKGARAYFMHHILHDWSEKYCLKILGNLKKAMKPGYSKLLVHELILPDEGVSVNQAMWDIAMMTANSGAVRSQRQWRELLDKAGFEVVKFWVHESDPDSDGIIEAVLRSDVPT